MKKLSSLFLFTFMYTAIILSQNCISEGETLTLSSQIEIDNFSTNYPNCTEITGNLTIEGSDITSLTGLITLNRILGTLSIQNNESLDNLVGLDSLSQIKNLNIIGNESLERLTGLNNLRLISGSFRLLENHLLKNLEGLDNLARVNGSFAILFNDALENLNGLKKNNLSFFYSSISITGNKSLKNLEGLENLNEVYGVTIKDNASLESLDGLNNLNSIVFDLKIIGNYLLRDLNGLDNLSSIGGGITLNNSKLENLKGLENLSSLGELVGVNSVLSIVDNESLKNLEGLENLSSFTLRLFIKNNASLENLNGLVTMTPISGASIIEDNPALKNLKGMEKIASIHGLRIINNKSLESLSGLENLSLINFDFHLEGNDMLRNLEELENLASIGGALKITSNTSLEDLKGLNSLASVGSLEIQNNELLESLEGLEQLLSIGWNFEIIDNNSLRNLKGLNNLSSIGGYFEISNNDSLERLEGLENLSTIASNLRIKNNDSLIDITQLGKVFQYYLTADTDDTSNTYITISSNPNLSMCAFYSLCSFVKFFPNNISIQSNGSNCSSRTQILENCEDISGKINISIFHDKDANGLFDNEEDLISGIPIQVEPIGINLISNANIGANIYFLADGDYFFSYDQLANDDRWMLTTDSMSYQVSIDSENKCDTVRFGVQAIPYSELIPVTTSAPTRCNELVPFYISANNTGTTLINGIVWLSLDESIEEYDFAFNSEPDTIVQNHIGWYFENLNPGEQVKKEIKLLVPGPPSFELGDELLFTTTVNYEDDLGTHSKEIQYSTAVLCSWDPNDKRVQPARLGNYTLFEENLVFTIRFQNTGNADAYHVSVKDTLDTNLDFRTFKVLDTSHPDKLTTTIMDNRFVSFNFDYIYLPDSTSNPEASQGYVTYTINPIQVLDENTVIENTASIFFDANPPIVTNTTQNTMVTCLPYKEVFVEIIINDTEVYTLPDGTQISEGGIYINEILDEEGCIIELVTTNVEILTSTIDLQLNPEFDIFPNPNSGVFDLTINGNISSKYNVIMYDITGQQVYEQQCHSKNATIKANNLSAGIYTVQIIRGSGEVFALKRVVLQQ